MKKKRNQKGFTLIELLVVIAIIGILAVVAVPALFKNINKAKVADVESDYNAFKSASLSYYTDNNKMPTKDKLKSYMDTVPQDSAFGGTYDLKSDKGVDGDKPKDELVLTITNPKISQEQMKKLVKDIGQDKIYVDGTAMTDSNAKAVDSGTVDIVLIDNTNM